MLTACVFQNQGTSVSQSVYCELLQCCEPGVFHQCSHCELNSSACWLPLKWGGQTATFGWSWVSLFALNYRVYLPGPHSMQEMYCLLGKLYQSSYIYSRIQPCITLHDVKSYTTIHNYKEYGGVVI